MFSSLVLFDVDGTLTESFGEGHAHFIAFEKAFEKVYGIKTSISKVEGNGTPDWNIAIKTLALDNLSEAQVDEKILAFFNELDSVFKELHAGNTEKALPGAKNLLIELKKRNCLLGLVTGNSKAIAFEKVNAVGLNNFFVLGGFGNQAKKRPLLVEIALKQAKKEFGFDNIEKTFIIGDTQHDISAAKANNVKVIAVQSGFFKDLIKYNPDFLFESLENTNEILKVLDLK